MKLSDTTTVATLREFIGQKIMTRTSRSPIKVTGIEVTENEAWFLGLEGSRKRRIKIQYISEIWAEDEDEKPKKKSKTSDELKEERLKKAEKAEAKLRPDEKKTKNPDVDMFGGDVSPSIYTL